MDLNRLRRYQVVTTVDILHVNMRVKKVMITIIFNIRQLAIDVCVHFLLLITVSADVKEEWLKKWSLEGKSRSEMKDLYNKQFGLSIR